MSETKVTQAETSYQYGRSYVITNETTTSSTYTSLTTAQSVTVNVGISGIAQIFIGGAIGNTGAGNYSNICWSATGANTITSSDNNSLYWRSSASLAVGSCEIMTGKTFFMTGLTPGSTTFTLQFKTTAGTAAYERRELWVLAL